MEVINPIGRSVADEMQADYSLKSVRCKCSTGALYAVGVNNSGDNHCACSDGYGTIGTRVYAG